MKKKECGAYFKTAYYSRICLGGLRQTTQNAAGRVGLLLIFEPGKARELI